jgi:hypothetical protein
MSLAGFAIFLILPALLLVLIATYLFLFPSPSRVIRIAILSPSIPIHGTLVEQERLTCCELD